MTETLLHQRPFSHVARAQAVANRLLQNDGSDQSFDHQQARQTIRQRVRQAVVLLRISRTIRTFRSSRFEGNPSPVDVSVHAAMYYRISFIHAVAGNPKFLDKGSLIVGQDLRAQKSLDSCRLLAKGKPFTSFDARIYQCPENEIYSFLNVRGIDCDIPDASNEISVIPKAHDHFLAKPRSSMLARRQSATSPRSTCWPSRLAAFRQFVGRRR